MALLEEGKHIHLRSVGVHNITARYVQGNPNDVPCTVICLGCAGVPQKWTEYRGLGGRASVFGDIVVFDAYGDVANTNVSHPRQNPSERFLAEQMNRNYQALRTVDLAPIVASYQRAGQEWPTEKTESVERIFGLYDIRWQAQELMEHTAPMRENVEGVGDANVNYDDLLSAAQALDDWKTLLPERVRDARNSLAQLYERHARNGVVKETASRAR
jgi:hypothetical protein